MAKIEIKQAARALEIITPLGPDVLGLRSLHVREQLSGGFTIEVELSSNDPDIKFDDIVGHPVAIRLDIDGGGKRYWHALVARFMSVETTGSHYHYRAVLVPWLWALTRSADCRIFQTQKLPEIIQQVFRDRGANDFELRLSGTYQPSDYCVQYRETDFNFVSRLMEEEGIAYYFKHDTDLGKLIMADEKAAYDTAPGCEQLVYRPTGEKDERPDGIHTWEITHEVQSTQYALSDYNPLKPKESLLRTAKVDRGYGMNDRQIFDYPGDYTKPGDAERLSRIRLDEIQAASEIIHARTTCFGLGAGHLFTLKDQPRAEQNREYLVTSIDLRYDAGEFASGPQAKPKGSCAFTAIPSSQTYRPPRHTPKPTVHGMQSAVVVGPSGEEIYTDEHGRVKVHFFWDRVGKSDETSSCWLRIAQGWAGKKWGAFYLPRIGHEVLVSFLEGDPDRPIVTGCVYNGENNPPYPLPAEKTKSTLKSLSSKGGGGGNEIRFEDKKGEEQVFLHAEKDQDVRVKHDTKEWIGNERHLIVTKDQLETVEGDKHSTVKGNSLSKVEGDRGETIKGNQLTAIDGNLHLTVKGDQCAKVDGDENLKAGGNWNNEAGQKISLKSGTDIHGKAGTTFAMVAGTSVHIKAGTTLLIEAGVQLSLKVGGNFIDIGPAGVSIKGTMVMINSGGAAGSGGGSSPTAPAAPEAPDAPKEPKPVDAATVGAVTTAEAKPTEKPKGKLKTIKISAAAAVLHQAAADGTPFCEECARAAAEAETEVAEELAVISSIAWVDGAVDKEVGAATQWVNLPHEAKWVDVPNGVTNIDRLGRKARFKVTFSGPGSHAFKVKAAPDDTNGIYTPGEEGRNANFKWLKDEKSYTTGSDGTKVVEADFFTTCAGLDSFKLVAEDTQNSAPVETGLISTRRLVYVVVIKMKGMTTNVDLGTLKGEFVSHGIDLVELPAVEIERMANIGPTEEDAYKQKCKTAFNGSKGKDKLPYAVAVGFTEHLAVKNPSQLLELPGIEAGPDKGPVEIPVMARGLRNGDPLKARKLWKDLVPGEGWFVSATFTPDAGGAAKNIPEAKCTALPTGSSNCASVQVDVADLPAGTGTLRVAVNVVDRMRGGLSFTGGNLICICTKGWWQDAAAGVQHSTAIHELGHKVGMVADGKGKLPDKVATHYTDKGHVGAHCHFGLAVLDTYIGAKGSKCVMFGAVGAGSPTAFCEKCAPAMKKLDLGTGWTV